MSDQWRLATNQSDTLERLGPVCVLRYRCDCGHQIEASHRIGWYAPRRPPNEWTCGRCGRRYRVRHDFDATCIQVAEREG